MKKKLIGITGGIGSGKSIVAQTIENAGYPIIKSDFVAKELMNSDPRLKAKIIAAFGNNSYLNDKINREYLSKEIFSSPDKIDLMNSIVHPPTTKKVKALAKGLFEKHDYVFVESALIYEAGIEENFDLIILVKSNEKNRLQRIKERDNTTIDEIKRRMEFQLSDDVKSELADFVIENDSSIKDLEERTKFILSIIKSLAS
jgi:dephospho-CoA kinase